MDVDCIAQIISYGKNVMGKEFIFTLNQRLLCLGKSGYRVRCLFFFFFENLWLLFSLVHTRLRKRRMSFRLDRRKSWDSYLITRAYVFSSPTHLRHVCVCLLHKKLSMHTGYSRSAFVHLNINYVAYMWFTVTWLNLQPIHDTFT